jgi:hypothetical protein
MEEERGIPEGVAGNGRAGLVAPKEEEAARGLSQIQQRASPASLAESLPTAVLLKTSFSAHCSEK